MKIGRYKVVTFDYGAGEDVLFLLNGGPGLPCDYLRDPLDRDGGQGLSGRHL